MINQYALDNNIGDDTDVFTILSQMQLEYNVPLRAVREVSPTVSHIEWTTEEVLELFNS